MKQSARFPYNFVNFMALVVLLVFGIYAGAYWIGVALWEDEFDEDGQESGVDDGLPWTPFNALTVAQLGTVSSLFLWLTVCVTGLGSELVLGEWLVGKLSVGSGTVLWHGAQLLFSLCISISLFAATPLALPFTVVGLWKFVWRRGIEPNCDLTPFAYLCIASGAYRGSPRRSQPSGAHGLTVQALPVSKSS